VPQLILGTVQLGMSYGINKSSGKPALNESVEILKTAWEHGIRVLDTADAYGEAQVIIGRYHLGSHHKFKVNSKFKNGLLSPAKQLDKILEEVQINELNIFFYHDFNDFVNRRDLLPKLLKLKECGRIKQIGVSVYEKSEMESVINEPLVDAIQLPFNLFDNINERGVLLAKAKEKGKLTQVRSIFLQGLFFKSPDSLPVKLLPLRPYLVRINEISRESNLSVEEIAIAYAIQQPLIDEIIIGVETVEQLKQNLELFTKDFPKEICAEIDKITIPAHELLYPKNWN
jgi:aryl-alcohol dehydrogenase-like predicted oxidoreductase